MNRFLMRLLPVFLLLTAMVSGSEKKATKGGEKHLSVFRSVSGKTQMHNKQPFALPDTVTIFYDDLESGVSDWETQGSWKITTETANSPTHSFHHAVGLDESDTLSSPDINLPNIDAELEELHFSFAVWAEMIDAASPDGLLEDYYRLWVKDMDNSIRGYSNEWVEYLDSPDIQIKSNDYKLTFKLLYRLEPKSGLPYTCLLYTSPSPRD